MTNSIRVLGWKAGVIVFFGDCLIMDILVVPFCIAFGIGVAGVMYEDILLFRRKQPRPYLTSARDMVNSIWYVIKSHDVSLRSD